MDQCRVPSNLLMEALPSIERDRLTSYATEIDLAENNILHEAARPIEFVYFPHQGLISLIVVTPNKAMAEAGFVGCEGAIGTSYDLDTRASFTRSVVVVGGTALRLPLARFERLLEQSAVLRRLVSQNNNRITERGQQMAACNLLHRLEERVCRWLLQSVEHGGGSDVMITQDDLAHMLGVSRARLNETLKSLQALEAIATGQRGILRIRDAGLVARHACPCFEVMKAMVVEECC